MHTRFENQPTPRDLPEPAAVPLPLRNYGVIVLGGGFRLPPVRHNATADRGAMILGGGFRLPTSRR